MEILQAFGITAVLFVIAALMFTDLFLSEISERSVEKKEDKRVKEKLDSLRLKNAELHKPVYDRKYKRTLPLEFRRRLKSKSRSFLTSLSFGEYSSAFSGEEINGYYIVTYGMSKVPKSIAVYDANGVELNEPI